MISENLMPKFNELSKKLIENSEYAAIILDNSSENISYSIDFRPIQLPINAGIKLQVKDQYGKDKLTDGFLIDDNAALWVFEKIERHLS